MPKPSRKNKKTEVHSGGSSMLFQVRDKRSTADALAVPTLGSKTLPQLLKGSVASIQARGKLLLKTSAVLFALGVVCVILASYSSHSADVGKMYSPSLFTSIEMPCPEEPAVAGKESATPRYRDYSIWYINDDYWKQYGTKRLRPFKTDKCWTPQQEAYVEAQIAYLKENKEATKAALQQMDAAEETSGWKPSSGRILLMKSWAGLKLKASDEKEIKDYDSAARSARKNFARNAYYAAGVLVPLSVLLAWFGRMIYLRGSRLTRLSGSLAFKGELEAKSRMSCDQIEQKEL